MSNVRQDLLPDPGSERRGSRFRVDLVDETGNNIKPRRTPVPAADMSSYYNDSYSPPELEVVVTPASPPKMVPETPPDVRLVSKQTSAEEPSMPLQKISRQESRLSQQMLSYGNVQTVDRLPNIDNYRNIHSITAGISARPTLRQLHAGNLREEMLLDEDAFQLGLDKTPKDTGTAAKLQHFPAPSTNQPVKFGWIQGVFIRCTLSILGVMLYLRLSWITGQAGIGLSSVIVLISSTVTGITALSMCAICTNGEVKAGGVYFMISRALGAEFGGSIGVIFTLANMLSAAMYIVGFGETVRDLLIDQEACIVDCALMDIRIIGWATAVLLLVIVLIGVSFEAKAQLVLLVILVVSMINYWVGSVIPPNDEKRAQGITGYSGQTFVENFGPHMRGEDFFTLFGIYFPSATGIMAGANISGDLNDPSSAIPKGTLLAILVTTLLYLSVVWTTGSTCIRDASGIVSEYAAGNYTDCVKDLSCSYGLLNHYGVIELESGTRYLITAGIFAATLSSALAALVSAPKIFQAVSKDRLFPFIHHIGKPYGKAGEPRLAYILAFIVVMAVIGLGDLNIIAPFVSNFFLASYCLVNYACFDASIVDSPGFRPSFRYYNMWVSLVGALLCVAIMFVIKWEAALVTLLFVLLLYLFIWYRKPEVNWGSSSQASVYKGALQKVLRLQNVDSHVKNYRPQILVLSGNPVSRPSLVDFAANITKDISMLACGHVILMKPNSRVLGSIQNLHSQVINWFKKRKVKAFYYPVASTTMFGGTQSLVQLCGVSQIRPNILLLGYKSNWTSTDCTLKQIREYFRLINLAFEAHLGVGILRCPGGLDMSDPMKELQMNDAKHLSLPEPSGIVNSLEVEEEDEPSGLPSGRNSSEIFTLTPNSRPPSCEVTDGQSQLPVSFDNRKMFPNGQHLSAPRFTEPRPSLADLAHMTLESGRNTGKSAFRSLKKGELLSRQTTTATTTSGATLGTYAASRQSIWNPQQEQLMTSINRFRTREKKATIDVWWLFDDGGLTLLIPHMLTLPKSYLEGAKLRVFALANRQSALEQEKRSMATLLNKFRIDYHDVFLIPDITRSPKKETKLEFESLVRSFKALRSQDDISGEPELESELTSDVELEAMKQKTNRQLRTRELLLEHSSDADLVVLTLPVPREGSISSCLYMAWLEMLTRDMPPMLLLRGNQQSVLTFYS